LHTFQQATPHTCQDHSLARCLLRHSLYPKVFIIIMWHHNGSRFDSSRRRQKQKPNRDNSHNIDSRSERRNASQHHETVSPELHKTKILLERTDQIRPNRNNVRRGSKNLHHKPKRHPIHPTIQQNQQSTQIKRLNTKQNPKNRRNHRTSKVSNNPNATLHHLTNTTNHKPEFSKTI
jgi:hypothetical protein